MCDRICLYIHRCILKYMSLSEYMNIVFGVCA